MCCGLLRVSTLQKCSEGSVCFRVWHLVGIPRRLAQSPMRSFPSQLSLTEAMKPQILAWRTDTNRELSRSSLHRRGGVASPTCQHSPALSTPKPHIPQRRQVLLCRGLGYACPATNIRIYTAPTRALTRVADCGNDLVHSTAWAAKDLGNKTSRRQ